MTIAAHPSNAPPWPLRQLVHFLYGRFLLHHLDAKYIWGDADSAQASGADEEEIRPRVL